MRKKIPVLILVVLSIILAGPQIRSLKTTSLFSEKIIDGVKLSQKDNITLFTKPLISCRWKDPKKDDGLKICSVDFIISSKKNLSLSNPRIFLDFLKPEEVTDIRAEISDDFYVIEENVPLPIKKIQSKKPHKRSRPRKKTLNVLTTASTRPKKPPRELLIKKITEKRVQRKHFKNFRPLESSLVINKKPLKKLNSVLAKSSAKTLSSKNLAVRLSFQVPKYSSNAFNFSIFGANFDAKIDPPISGCGILDTPNSTYTLSSDLNSTGTCFNIYAENITLDCMGHKINYSYSASGYGIYSNATGTIIKNCSIVQENPSVQYAYGVYINSADNASIEKNSISQKAPIGAGVYLKSSKNSKISSNNITAHDGYGIYLDFNSQKNNITSNRIITNSTSGYGIYISSSPQNRIEENNIRTYQKWGYAIRLSTSDSTRIEKNNITVSGIYTNAIDLDSDFYTLIDHNNITILSNPYAFSGIYASLDETGNITNNFLTIDSPKGKGIELEESIEMQVINNTINTTGEYGYGIYVHVDSDDSVIKNNLIKTSGNYSYGIVLESTSYWSRQKNNTINTTGFSATGLFIDFGYHENLRDFKITTYGNNSYGIYITGGGKNISFDNFNILTSGKTAHSIYLYNLAPEISVSNSTLNSTGIQAKNLYIGPNVNGGLWNFTNSTNPSLNWLSPYGKLNIFYFIEALTRYQNGTAISGANVSIKDRFGTNRLNATTNSNGLIPKKAYLAYEKNSTTTIGYSVFTINATYQNSSVSKTLDLSKSLFVTLLFFSPGKITLISPANNSVWTSSKEVKFYYNFSMENITNCSLYLDSVPRKTKTDVEKNKTLSFEIEPSIGAHNWSVSCVNSSSGVFNSDTFFFTYNYKRPGGGGGRGGGSCEAEWVCSEWSSCVNGKKTRTCENKKPQCSKGEKPKEEEKCKEKEKKEKKKEEDKKRKTLFDIILEAIEKYPKNGVLNTKVSLINFGIPGKVIANISYQIFNSKKEKVLETKDSVAVETQNEYIKKFDISSLPPGEYTLLANLSYEGQKEPASSEIRFTIPGKRSIVTTLIGIFVLLIAIFFMIVIYIKRKKARARELLDALIDKSAEKYSSVSYP